MTRLGFLFPAIAVLGALAAFVAIMALVTPAQAATIVVDTIVDDTNANGDCNLREAIIAAETDTAFDTCPAGSGADVITLPAGTYVLSQGQFDISTDITINGAGAASTIIDAAGSSRVFQYELPNASAGGLNDLTVQNGSAGSGGALFIDAIVAINNVVVKDSFADGDGGGIFIDTTGTLNATNCTVSGNSAAGDGGGIANEGPDTLNLSQCQITENDASDNGGGISNIFEASANIDATTISGNTSVGDGGGIYSNQCCGADPFVITNSTISGNASGDDDGGGMNVEDGVATLTNVTISGNEASDTGGGFRVDDGSTATLTNVTITGNRANTDSGGGLAAMDGGTATLLNTTVAQNTAGGDCFIEAGGTLTSSGNNLSGDATCGFAAAGDLQNTNAALGALALNAPGTTQTHALPATSPAVDAGASAGCPATDQRGVARPQDGNNDGTAACDIGAYEFLTPPVESSPTPAPVTQAPAALPPTGGVQDSGSSVAWLGLAALLAAMAGGALVFSRARR